jgi:site-specific DNA recombinase
MLVGMPSKVIPVLGAARLSKDADESTSIERQSSGINGWADLRTNTTGDRYYVVHVTEDPDASGAVSPFDRAGLGPYLRKPLLDAWQVLVVFRLDRLTRSIADFEAIWKFLEANGKTLVSVAEQIDFGTTAGRLMARQLVIFAEYEREMIRARVKNAYDAAQKAGRYAGLQFPFGYIPVKLAGKGWGLEPHPIYGPIVEQAADRLTAGESLSAICRWLDAEGIPTPRNIVREYKGNKPLRDDARWNQTSLAAIFRSPAVIGDVTVNDNSVHRAKTLRDDSGTAINRAEPLISREKWEQVTEILAQNAERQGPMVYRAPLLRVAYCAQCSGPLNTTTATWNGRMYRYYRCSNERLKRGCDAKRIKAEDLESAVETLMLETYGEYPLTEVVEIAGIDYSTQMHELAEAIGDLSTKIALGRVAGQDVSPLEEQRRIHETNLAALAEEQDRSGRQPTTNERPTGKTFADRWHGLDWNGRNDLLRRNEIKLYTKKHPGGYVSVTGGADVEAFTRGEYFKTLHDITTVHSETL